MLPERSVDFTGPGLETATFAYTQPGVYVPTATAIGANGNRVSASMVVQVFSPATLDTALRAKWNAMRDALRAGDIAGAVSQIVADARDGYATAFQTIAARLAGIDAILTNITFAEARGAALIYHTTRTDDGVCEALRGAVRGGYRRHLACRGVLRTACAYPGR